MCVVVSGVLYIWYSMFVEVSGVALVEVSGVVHVWYSVCGSEWCGVRVV